MAFELTAEQFAVQETCRLFAEKEVAPRAAAIHQTGAFPYDLVQRMGELGLFGLLVPEGMGGAGGDFLSYCLALEQIARFCRTTAITLEAAVSLGIDPLVRFATPEQRQHLGFDALVQGQALWAFGLTEPEAGSDAGGTRTTAVREGDTWRINGTKRFITNAGTDISAGVTITAVTTPGMGVKGISTIAIPRGTPGYRWSAPYDKLGWRGSDTRELICDDVVVPAENLIGLEGRGFIQFMDVLGRGRVAIAALCLGMAEQCLHLSVEHAKLRQQFGRPIADFQGIQFKLAEMKVWIEAARALTYGAAAHVAAHGVADGTEAEIAKLVASRAASYCATAAMQIHGGEPFVDRNHPIAIACADYPVNEIGEGTSNVLRILITRDLLRPPIVRQIAASEPTL